MKILALESSCDDLAVCLFEFPNFLLTHRVASQEKIHSLYGGIVPEIASREHLNSVVQVMKSALDDSGLQLSDLQGLAVTGMPGLIGSLLVGVNFIKGLALAQNLPWVAVNHLEGHLMSGFLEAPEPEFPFLGLVVSGGHTHLYRVEDFGRRTLLGHTVDDAAGEAYDKVAKLLGLGYPGGPILDRLAALGNPKAFSFSIPKVKSSSANTSFSGLKTAVVEIVKKYQLLRLLENTPIEACNLALDLIASFQHTVVRMLKLQFEKAYQIAPANTWVISGGVACNSAIRKQLEELAEEKDCRLLIPAPRFCTDNAAMIAYVGGHYLMRGMQSDFGFNPMAS